MSYNPQVAALEARLAAQRKAIQWLLERLVCSKDDLRSLESFITDGDLQPDHQEDPGAVPTPGFGAFISGQAEVRLLIKPLHTKLAKDD